MSKDSGLTGLRGLIDVHCEIKISITTTRLELEMYRGRQVVAG